MCENGDVLVVAELGVVEEEGRLGRRLLLERDGCRLGGAFAGDLDVRDLAAVPFVSSCHCVEYCRRTDLPEAEEVLDLLVFSLGRDVRNLDSVGGSHLEELYCWVWCKG